MSAIPSNGKQFVAWLRRDGWTVVRQRGGHLQMRHPSGAQHTIALGMGGRNISNAVAELRRRGLVGASSKLARQTATSGEVVTVATIAEHVEASGQPAPKRDGRRLNRAMEFIRAHSDRSDAALADELKLRPTTIARYRRYMGDVNHHRTAWTAAEDSLLTAEWGRSSADDIAATLSRTSRAVWARAARLGLTGRPDNPLRQTKPAPAAAPSATPPTVTAPAATPMADAGPGLVYRLRLSVGNDGWAVAINGKAQPAMPGLLPAMVGAAIAMTEQTMGYAVPAETKAALVKALRGGAA